MIYPNGYWKYLPEFMWGISMHVFAKNYGNVSVRMSMRVEQLWFLVAMESKDLILQSIIQAGVRWTWTELSLYENRDLTNKV